ncbi:hypothetical protein ANO14919_033550 [Xylariales sp. No.14919]|nr:hypothetical protein ANO14919_033550 [Xylariales sp. No.14919]
MDGPIHDSRADPSRPERKRLDEHHGVDEQRVRRHSNEYGDDTYVRRRRSRSPHRSERLDRRDYRRVGDMNRARHHEDARDDRYKTGHRNSAGHHAGSRSRSPTHHRHNAHHRRDSSHRHRPYHKSTASRQDRTPELLYGARPLSRSADFDTFRPLFARYLDIQKQIDIATIDEREVRGRWKSFVNKWNTCELAEGWYRPGMLEDAMDDFRAADDESEGDGWHASSARRNEIPGGKAGADLQPQDTDRKEEDSDDDDDDYGPTLPALGHTTKSTNPPSQTKHGPGIPSLSDLTLRRELDVSDRDDARALLRQERKADRALQKERLEELAPRADAGTQARRLEKRREARDASASFANAKSSNEMPDLADADLMGDDGGGLEEYKRLKRESERKKTEREVRREEIWRAKKEEREERAREYREREAHTVEMLREIAKSRFG